MANLSPTQPLIETLHGNIKRMPHEVRLSRLTALVADNWTGKTSVLMALDMLARQKAPFGRESRANWLSYTDGEDIQVWGSGAAGEARISLEGKTVQKSAFQHRFPVLSTPDFQALLAGESLTREAILRQYPMPVEGIDNPEWTVAKKAVKPGDDVLAGVFAWARAEDNKLGGLISTLEEELATAKRQASAAAPEHLLELRSKLKRAVAHEAFARSQAALDNARQQLTEFVPKPVDPPSETAWADWQHAYEVEVENIETQLSQYAELDGRIERVMAGLVIVKAAIDAHCEVCPLCMQPAILSQMRMDLQERLVELTGLVAHAVELRARLATLEEDRLVRAREFETAKRAAAKADANNLAQRTKLESQVVALEVVLNHAEAYEGPPSVELEAQLKSLEEASGAKAHCDVLKKRLLVLEARKRDIGALKDACESKAAEVLEAAKTKAEADVNVIMPRGLVARLNIEDGACEWCVVDPDSGQLRNKVLMSGAQRKALIIARACARAKGALVLLDDDDVGPMSSVTFRDMLAKLSEVAAQVVVACARPVTDLPENYTVINVGAQ